MQIGLAALNNSRALLTDRTLTSDTCTGLDVEAGTTSPFTRSPTFLQNGVHVNDPGAIWVFSDGMFDSPLGVCGPITRIQRFIFFV